MIYFFVQGIRPWEFPGVDARAYWGIDLAHPYVESGVGVISTYLYSPAFAQLLAPFSLLPFPIFFAIWTAINVAILIWLVRPWPWALLILLLPIVYELCVGNIHFLIAASIVLALRRPPLWSIPILTKITPGIGLIWFAIRREWRALAQISAAVALASSISYLVSPSAWLDWFALLTSNASRGDLLLPRVIAGGLLVAFGGLSNRPWLVPIGVWICLPVVWVNSWVILLAVIPLARPILVSARDDRSHHLAIRTSQHPPPRC